VTTSWREEVNRPRRRALRGLVDALALQSADELRAQRRSLLENEPQLAPLLGGAMEAEGAGGGGAWVLSDLRSLLETGKPLAS
jgi:hypothetical protein